MKQIEKVNPIFMAVVMSLLLFLLLPSGVLDDLRGVRDSQGNDVHVKTFAVNAMQSESPTESEDVITVHENALTRNRFERHKHFAFFSGLLEFICERCAAATGRAVPE